MTASKPAFPSLPIVNATDNRQYQRDGMTIRQLYKVFVLQGMLANEAITGHREFSMTGVCIEAGRYADALICEDERFEKASKP